MLEVLTGHHRDTYTYRHRSNEELMGFSSTSSHRRHDWSLLPTMAFRPRSKRWKAVWGRCGWPATSFAAFAVWYTLYCAHLLRSRVCVPSWPTIPDEEGNGISIAVVTLAEVINETNSNTAHASSPHANKRSFKGVMDATWENRQEYANRHGYMLANASRLLDGSRPPSWSKILAVESCLDAGKEWVFWMDADSIVTNMARRLEDILPRASETHDFVLSKDAGGFNAGVWAMRNSAWSRQFLRTWWGMEEFVRARHPAETKSGDNDALKHLLAVMDRTTFNQKVGIVPQCTFNSYLFKISVRNMLRLLTNPTAMVQGLYCHGDFVLHLAGIDNKLERLSAFANP